MRFVGHIACTFAAIACVGCTGNSAVGTEEANNMVSDFEIKIVEKSLKMSYRCVGDTTYGADVDVYTTAGAVLQWPEKFGQADVTPLQDTLLVRCFGNDSVKVAINEAISAYVADPVTLDSDAKLETVDSIPTAAIGDNARMLEKEINVKLLSANSRIASFEVFRYMYGGGAHPIYASTFVNFDLLRSKVLEFADVIQPGKESELLSVVKHNLHNRYGVATDEQLEAASGINVEAISYALQSPTFYFNGSNIVFYFNPYEIGPWAIGTVEVPVSVYELEGIISLEAKKLLNE